MSTCSGVWECENVFFPIFFVLFCFIDASSYDPSPLVSAEVVFGSQLIIFFVRSQQTLAGSWPLPPLIQIHTWYQYFWCSIWVARPSILKPCSLVLPSSNQTISIRLRIPQPNRKQLLQTWKRNVGSDYKIASPKEISRVHCSFIRAQRASEKMFSLYSNNCGLCHLTHPQEATTCGILTDLSINKSDYFTCTQLARPSSPGFMSPDQKMFSMCSLY